jgi:hypothetical protein
MREAWRHWRYARSKGWHIGDDDPWTWARCLRFAAAQARARRPSGFEAIEAAMAEVMGGAAEAPGARKDSGRGLSPLLSLEPLLGLARGRWGRYLFLTRRVIPSPRKRPDLGCKGGALLRLIVNQVLTTDDVACGMAQMHGGRL